MRSAFTVFLVAIITAGCSRADTNTSINDIADSAKLITSEHKALEKAIWNYYVTMEKDLGNDLGVSEAEIIDRIQSLIDDGYAKKPVILVITEDGPRWASVDYDTYKEYMTSNAIILRRYYGTQPDLLDTVFMDSIRSNLLKALETDSVASENNDTLYH